MQSFSLVLDVMPFSFVLDNESRIFAFGRSIKRLIPTLEVGQGVSTYFTLVRPRYGMLCTASLSNLAETGVILQTPCGATFQMQAIPLPEVHGVLLAGTVRLSSVREFENSVLTLRDFPNWERTVDYLFTLREMEKETEARRQAEELAYSRELLALSEAESARKAQKEALESSNLLGSLACLLQSEIETPDLPTFIRRLLRLAVDHSPDLEGLAFLPFDTFGKFVQGTCLIPPIERGYTTPMEAYHYMACGSIPAASGPEYPPAATGFECTAEIRGILGHELLFPVTLGHPLISAKGAVGIIVTGSKALPLPFTRRVIETVTSSLSTVFARALLRWENQHIISRDQQLIRDIGLVFRAAKALKWSWLVASGEIVADDQEIMLDIWGARIAVISDVIERVVPADRLRVIARIDDTVLSGAVFDEQFRVRLDNGDERVFRTLALQDPLAEPEFPRILGITFDLTERVQIADRLQETEIYYKKLFEMMPDGIALCDYHVDIGEFGISNINNALLRMLGLPLAPDFTGRRISEVFPAPVMREVKKALKHDPSLVTPSVSELELPGLGDTMRYVRLEVSQVHRDGDRRVMFLRGFDVDAERREQTQRIMLAELQEKANTELRRVATLKDEFLASMSHELRTPLNGILGACELLLTGACGDLGDRQEEILTMCQGAGSHLLSIISDILDVSKIEAGKMELNWRTIDIAQLCDGLQRVLEPIALAKGINLEFDYEDLAGTPLMLDQTRFSQVLINLLGNAIKFSFADGSVQFRATVSPSSGFLSFDVCDRGIGIGLRDQISLFRPFEQASSGLARSHEGTGLGLTLVERIVQLHHGHIQVDSTSGQGSRFSVIVPHFRSMAELEAYLPDESRLSDARARCDSSQVWALIIDSQISRGASLTHMLRSRGIVTEWFEDTFDTLRDAASLKPKIVFVELGKSTNRALLLIEALKQNQHLQITVIGLSALLVDTHGEDLSSVYGLKGKIDGILAEPWNEDSISSLLGTLGIASDL